MNEHKKPTQIKFAPGCFDDFEGTQEELNELIADLKNMVTSGTLWENTLPVDEKEEEELIKLLAQKQARRKQ
jgi:transcription antitermination factor NusG